MAGILWFRQCFSQWLSWGVVLLISTSACITEEIDPVNHGNIEDNNHAENQASEENNKANNQADNQGNNSANSSSNNNPNNANNDPVNNHQDNSTPVVYDDILRPRFAPEEESFYRMPWPSDYRKTATGTIDISDFPHTRLPLIQKYQRELERIDGFSTMPVVYAGFESAVYNSALPTPPQTLQESSPVQLVELGEGCGHRIPLELFFDVEGDRFIDPYILKSTPLPGFILKPYTSYAWILLKTFGQPEHQSTESPEGFEQLLRDQSGADSTMHAVYAPLRECMTQANLSADDIAMASVFTTHDPTLELRQMRQVMLDPTRAQAPQIYDWAPWERATSGRQFQTWKGYVEVPILQRGNTPYANNGGGLEFDSAGLPIIHRWEEVPFAVTFPAVSNDASPILFWMDGTGAWLHGHVSDRHILAALEAGFTVVTFSPQFHDERAVPSSTDDLSTFNYLNPEAGRTNFRQQAAEVSYFVRVIREALVHQEAVPALDTDNMVYGGHSQGAIIGGILAGVETEFNAYALNGIGAYISSTIMERDDYIDIAGTIQLVLGVERPLDRVHPAIQLAQFGSDVVDPQNYAPYWRGWEEHPGGSHILLSNGYNDDTTASMGMDALTISGNIPPLAPAGWNPETWGIWTTEAIAPAFSGNEIAFDGSPLTMGHYMHPTQGHFTIYRETRAAYLFANFWSSSLDGIPFIRF